MANLIQLRASAVTQPVFLDIPKEMKTGKRGRRESDGRRKRESTSRTSVTKRAVVTKRAATFPSWFSAHSSVARLRVACLLLTKSRVCLFVCFKPLAQGVDEEVKLQRDALTLTVKQRLV